MEKNKAAMRVSTGYGNLKQAGQESGKVLSEQRLVRVECVNHVDTYKKSISVESTANAKTLQQEHGSHCDWLKVSNGKLVDQRGQIKQGKRLPRFQFYSD